MDVEFLSVHKNAEEYLNMYPAFVSSRLVNSAYFQTLHVKFTYKENYYYEKI